MASIDDSRTGMRKRTSIADLIVKGAIALVTAAFFIGAYLQFQVTFWLALISALSVYIALLMLHTLMRRSERVDALMSEVSRLEGELARVQSPRDAAYAPPPAAARAQPGRNSTLPHADVKMPPLSKQSQPSLGGLTSNSLGAPPPVPPSPKPTSAPAPSHAPPAAKRTERTAEPTLPPWPSATSGGGAESLHDYWSFRPEKASAPHEAPKALKKSPAPAQSEQEGDLEAVQGMIKRLAKEVSLGGDGAEGVSADPEDALRASLDALRTTAGTMRAATTKSGLSGLRNPNPSALMPPPIAPGHARLSSIAEAVAAGRMEARLGPIVGLADHQLHHYEVAICPRDEKGVELSVSGRDGQLAKTGLLPLIDGARLKWAAQISRSLAEEGPQNCVFTAVSAESLGSDRFLDDLAKAYRQREALAGELVLTFTMADIRTFGGVEWSALTDMRDLGFRFGLEAVTDLDYEFTALKAAGFGFIKLQAADVLNGLSGPAGVVSGADICHQMNGVGLSVIVGGIADEATRAAIVKAGLPLGQGLLFGPPATVTAETLSGSAAA